jgi:hypothetical protein
MHGRPANGNVSHTLANKESVGDDFVTVGRDAFQKLHHEFNAFYDWLIDKRENGLMLLGVRRNFPQQLPDVFDLLKGWNM